MQIKPYTSDNFAKVTPIYPFDSTVNLKNNSFYSDEHIAFNFSAALSSIADLKNNNFSQLFLTKRKKLSDFFTINPLDAVPESFSTFFAFRSVEGLGANTLYWAADDSAAGDVNSAYLGVDSAPEGLKNNHFFDIEFINQILCKISHEHNGIVRYLTLDYTFNLSLASDSGLSLMRESDPQVFYYFYDDVNDLLILYKKILDYPYFITYTTASYRCALRQPPTGPQFPFSTNGIIRMRPYSSPSDYYELQEHEVKYTKDNLSNILNTSETNSRTGIANNYLLNTEVALITGSDLPVNILTLKNELSPQNNNNVKSDFFQTDQFDYRQYNKIFTGTNQALGNDNISFGYDGFTQLVTFEPDKITFFHTPNTTYPFDQLNINDTTLSKIGAIAGDHPVKADKIFKKRATYKNYGPYGQSTDEASGVFLCAWLSGNADVNSTPVWMDRYYNPSTVSFYQALTATNNTSYISNFDNLEVASTLNSVFDKPSDLYLEPNTYYAYHHLGQSDIENYLKCLSDDIIQSRPTNYYVNNTQAVAIPEEIIEFSLDGQQYSIYSPLTAVDETNQFTVCFDLDTKDWSAGFANQIIGNFLDEGFGIFNERYITPFLYYYTENKLHIYNTSGNLLHSIPFENTIRGVWRMSGLKPYYVILRNGVIIKNNINNTTISVMQTPTVFDDIVSSFYDLSGAAILGIKDRTKQVVYLDYNNNTFTDITSSDNLITQYGIDLNDATHVVKYANNFYATDGFNAILNNGNLYYQQTNYDVRKWPLSAGDSYPFFNATNPIRSFNIDKDDNFWLLQDDKLHKYTSTRQYVLSAHLDNYSNDSLFVNFGNEITSIGNLYYTLVTTQHADRTDNKLTMLRYNSNGVFLNKFDSKADFADPLVNQNITGDDYIRRESLDALYPNTINTCITLTDIINQHPLELNLSYDVSKLGMGHHNFTVRLDTAKGSFAMFVDGLKVDEIYLEPGQYSASSALRRPLILGATSFYNNVTLPQYLKSALFYVTNSKVKNLTLYNSALNDFDIKLIASRNYPYSSINYNMPSGKRSYVEEVERFFKQDVPIKKSAAFNIKMLNMGNASDDLKAALAEKITNRVKLSLPYHSTISDIRWIHNDINTSTSVL